MEGSRERLLQPAALAPEPGSSQAVGEVSGAAEAFGVRAGIALGEALSRCPELVLVTPDAERTESMWEELIGRLESVGDPAAGRKDRDPRPADLALDVDDDLRGGRRRWVLNASDPARQRRACSAVRGNRRGR